MSSKLGKKLNLHRETVRTLSRLDASVLERVGGGISGRKGCQSIDYVCEPDSGGALCISKGICPSVFQSDCTC